MGKCKTKAIQGDYSGIFRHIQTCPDKIKHIQAYSGIIQAYSEPCVILEYSEFWYIQNSGIFRTTKTYSESWAIQNPGIFRTGGILRTLSNICNEALWATIIVASYFMSSSS